MASEKVREGAWRFVGGVVVDRGSGRVVGAGVLVVEAVAGGLVLLVGPVLVSGFKCLK